MKLLVTGGSGFIGSNFIRYELAHHPEDTIVNLDSLTYAAHPDTLCDVESDPRYQFIRGSIADGAIVGRVLQQGVDAVINFAAESHVDRSIRNPAIFVETNVVGTQVLLDAVRTYGVHKFVQISTDEVYGTLGPSGRFVEETPLAPNSPYSASKAGADLLVRAYFETFNLPVNITRCSNNYGPYQFPEKFIPLMVINLLEGRTLPLYGDGLNVRDWLHVDDHCSAIDLVLRQGTPGEIYNVGGSNERTNLEVVHTILCELGESEARIQFVADRPGHDRRYAIDSTKLQTELGWRPTYTFEAGIRETIRWYQEHQTWWRRVLSGEYLDYYKLQYGSLQA